MKNLCALIICSVLFMACNKGGANSSATAGSANANTASSKGLQSVYFDYDQSTIRFDAETAMQSNGSFLKQNTNNISVEGNCDDRGTNEYNLALGHRRAESTRNYLINLGVDPARMRTISYGEEKQVCYDATEDCWQRNRRADFRR